MLSFYQPQRISNTSIYNGGNCLNYTYTYNFSQLNIFTFNNTNKPLFWFKTFLNLYWIPDLHSVDIFLLPKNSYFIENLRYFFIVDLNNLYNYENDIPNQVSNVIMQQYTESTNSRRVFKIYDGNIVKVKDNINNKNVLYYDIQNKKILNQEKIIKSKKTCIFNENIFVAQTESIQEKINYEFYSIDNKNIACISYDNIKMYNRNNKLLPIWIGVEDLSSNLNNYPNLEINLSVILYRLF